MWIITYILRYRGRLYLYSSIENQLYNLAHFIFAFAVVFIIYPSIVFDKTNRSKLENFFSNFIRMVFLIIIAVYALTFSKVYEFLSIGAVMVFVYLLKTFDKNYEEKVGGMASKLNEKILNYSENVASPREDIKFWVNEVINKFKRTFQNRESILLDFLLISVFAYSVYLRFYDAVKHAAPPMADSYVVLGWAKWVSRREPFFYGIYPKGFHIFITMLQKFSFIDYLYIVKYTGPLCNVLITLGIYFFVSRLSGNKFIGIVSTIIYGILIQFLPGGFERQAATNSQEFGYIFVLPTTYFFYKYMVEDKRQDFISAFLGFTITALVHPVSTIFAALGGGIVMLLALLSNFKEHVKQVIKTIIAGVASGVIAILPIGIGLIMGKKLDNSSAEFLTSTTEIITAPTLMLFDYIALVSIAFIFLNILINVKKLRTKLIELIIFSLSIVAFFLYYYAGVITQSTVIITRFSGLWQLVIPITVGMGVFTILKVLRASNIRRIIEAITCIALICVCLFYIKPKPIIPYKMEYNSNVEQYLRIRNMLRPTEWTIISDIAGEDGGYDLVLGAGYHTHLFDFLSMYNPEAKTQYLTNMNNGDEEKSFDVFIFHEKKVFKTHFEQLSQIYLNREADNRELLNWIEKYKENHSNLSIFYEDENIRIYRIHQGAAREDVNTTIWGKK
jgi:hypothetical protein